MPKAKLSRPRARLNVFVLSSSPITSIRILLFNSTNPQLIQNPAVMQGFISSVRRKIIQPQKIIPDLHGVLITQFIYQLKRKRLRAFMYINILSEFFVSNNLRENHLVAVSFHHRNTGFLSMEWQFPTTDTPLFFALLVDFRMKLKHLLNISFRIILTWRIYI